MAAGSTIVTGAVFARRLLPGVHPAYVAGVLAPHPFLVWVGTEVRVYALVVLLSALMTLAFFDSPATTNRRAAHTTIAMVLVIAVHGYLRSWDAGRAAMRAHRRALERGRACVLDSAHASDRCLRTLFAPEWVRSGAIALEHHRLGPFANPMTAAVDGRHKTGRAAGDAASGGRRVTH